jgi:hypothetical protein
MDLSFYIHYNGVINEENPTFFELFITYFSGALLFKTQETDSEVFTQTIKYLRADEKKDENENFCSSLIKKTPGMDIGYLRHIMRKSNRVTLISYNNNETLIKPMAILVFKNGKYTDDETPYVYLDGICSDQQSPIRGIGSQLLSIFIDAAKTVGFSFIELASASKKASETWKKKGFQRKTGFRDEEGLQIYSLQLGGEEDKRVLLDLKHNNNILVCDKTCKNLGPMPRYFDSLNGINNYINASLVTNSNIKTNRGGKRTKKHKEKKHRTKKK